MKILIFSQRYWPENFRITEIAETLVNNGHLVTVLTGLPMYPGGYVYNSYKKKKNRYQTHNNVVIIRSNERERKNNFLSRYLNYSSYSHYAFKTINTIKDKFDIVLINELSPIMSVKAVSQYKKIRYVKTLMYEMDLWPESLLSGGIKKNGKIYNHYKKVSDNIYSSCDKILVSTKEHIDYIKALPKSYNVNIDYLPQYAESIFEDNAFEFVDNNKIDLMFAGNIGKAQKIDVIINAANLLKNNSKYVFHIVGSGSELENAKKLVKDLNLDNVIFYGQRPLEEMPELYKKADAMLVTLENKSYANMTIPGKVQSYMAAGKPIIGSISGSTYNLIKENGIGYVCEAEQPEELAKIILGLEYDDLVKIGKHSREVYFKNFSKEKFINTLIDEMNKLVNKK